MRKIAALLCLSVLIVSACSTPGTREQTDATVQIYTTVYPLQYFTERLGGEYVDVSTIYPPGADAHTYEPTTKKMTEIAEADAFFYFGEVLEPFADTVAQALTDEHVQLVEFASHEELFEHENEHQEVKHEEGHNGHAHGDHDPHIWLDPLRSMELASILKDELITLMPKHQQKIKENFASLKEELLQLDEQLVETLQSKKQKTILVAHAGYGYWEERYGIEQLAVNGVNNSSGPSQIDLVHIMEEAREHQLSYMVFEQNISDSISSKIQKEMGVKATHIHNLSVLTEEDIKEDQDYFTLMRQNLEVLDLVTD
ncbi:zinc ABC transporter substrate-binding protein [Radiobacillus kanasensis]|uniref:metal ABC transporter solute-binding protein, Zn/Mn family n=1 Tax=Radiobacillus kanasensis TaxID=2844358 RepID=UPI001E58828D|nr:zinc ABC transporter substrate-binding protein [Radiobacillus kanasensis]UFT98262.1 zinc ABC transporter substrate-binding protein [Radiobacillus kanasensis]